MQIGNDGLLCGRNKPILAWGGAWTHVNDRKKASPSFLVVPWLFPILTLFIVELFFQNAQHQKPLTEVTWRFKILQYSPGLLNRFVRMFFPCPLLYPILPLIILCHCRGHNIPYKTGLILQFSGLEVMFEMYVCVCVGGGGCKTDQNQKRSRKRVENRWHKITNVCVQ